MSFFPWLVDFSRYFSPKPRGTWTYESLPPKTKHPLRIHGLVGNFHIIGTIYGVFYIRVMGLLNNLFFLKVGYPKSNGKKKYFILIFPIQVPPLLDTPHAMILDGPGSGFAMGSGLNSHGTISARRQIQKPHSECCDLPIFRTSFIASTSTCLLFEIQDVDAERTKRNHWNLRLFFLHLPHCPAPTKHMGLSEYRISPILLVHHHFPF